VETPVQLFTLTVPKSGPSRF